VKIKGRWTYLYRAVDSDGKSVVFLLRAKRDVAAAKAFFRRAFKSQGRLPRAITLDGYQASHRAAREFLGEHRRGKRAKLRSSKYLNNLIEQLAAATLISGLGLLFGGALLIVHADMPSILLSGLIGDILSNVVFQRTTLERIPAARRQIHMSNVASVISGMALAGGLLLLSDPNWIDRRMLAAGFGVNCSCYRLWPPAKLEEA
jgi:hypothetical protein